MSGAGEKVPEPLEEYLRLMAGRLLPGRPALQSVRVLAPQVWCVEAVDGRRLVAKYQLFGECLRGTAVDLLAVEEKVLGLLGAAGCAVPRMLGADARVDFAFFEYGGAITLDDLAQEDPPAARQWAARAAGELRRIEAVFAREQEALLAHVLPAADLSALQRAWRTAGEGARQGLEGLLRGRGSARQRAARLLDEVLAFLAARPPRLGSTDYNARNVLVDGPGNRVCFLEFAKIGWDWPERRLVQYATSLGGGRAAGRFVALLDKRAAHLHGGDGAALDGHWLVFLLNAAARLLGAESPWESAGRRLAQLGELFAVPLGEDPLSAALRADILGK